MLKIYRDPSVLTEKLYFHHGQQNRLKYQFILTNINRPLDERVSFQMYQTLYGAIKFFFFLIHGQF